MFQSISLSGSLKSPCSHHLDVGPGDGKDGSRPIWGSAHHPKGLGGFAHDGAGPSGNDRVGGEEGREVGLDANGAHARAAATVRDAEGFVKVEVGDVAAVISRSTKTHLGVHVCPVKVNLYQKQN